MRAPVSIEHLLALRRVISLSNPFHAAVWAVATCAFFSCRRLGEVTVASATSFDPLLNVTRGTSVYFRDLRSGVKSATFHIPWMKTTKEEGFTVILTTRGDELCPYAALKNHLAVNAGISGSLSLFAYSTAEGHHVHMFKHVFLKFINDIWALAGLYHILGHCFCIGGAVELLLAGVPPEVVAATGGWASLAFLLYWHRMEEILPLSTSKAYNVRHISDLAAIFEQFRVDNNIPTRLIDPSREPDLFTLDER